MIAWLFSKNCPLLKFQRNNSIFYFMKREQLTDYKSNISKCCIGFECVLNETTVEFWIVQVVLPKENKHCEMSSSVCAPKLRWVLWFGAVNQYCRSCTIYSWLLLQFQVGLRLGVPVHDGCMEELRETVGIRNLLFRSLLFYSCVLSAFLIPLAVATSFSSSFFFSSKPPSLQRLSPPLPPLILLPWQAPPGLASSARSWPWDNVPTSGLPRSRSSRGL